MAWVLLVGGCTWHVREPNLLFPGATGVSDLAALAGRGNLAVVAELDAPLLFAVGLEDTVTAPAFSRQLFDACPLPSLRKTPLHVAGAMHESVTGTAEFRRAMARFVEAVGERPLLLP